MKQLIINTIIIMFIIFTLMALLSFIIVTVGKNEEKRMSKYVVNGKNFEDVLISDIKTDSIWKNIISDAIHNIDYSIYSNYIIKGERWYNTIDINNSELKDKVIKDTIELFDIDLSGNTIEDKDGITFIGVCSNYTIRVRLPVYNDDKGRQIIVQMIIEYNLVVEE